MEVVRGSQSALYGSDAVTSVINVVTQRGEGRRTFDALLEGGSFGTYRLATGGGGAYRGFSWSYDLSRLRFGRRGGQRQLREPVGIRNAWDIREAPGGSGPSTFSAIPTTRARRARTARIPISCLQGSIRFRGISKICSAIRLGKPSRLIRGCDR